MPVNILNSVKVVILLETWIWFLEFLASTNYISSPEIRNIKHKYKQTETQVNKSSDASSNVNKIRKRQLKFRFILFPKICCSFFFVRSFLFLSNQISHIVVSKQ